MTDLDILKINPGDIDPVNRFLADPDNEMTKELRQLIEKFGGA